MPKSSEISTIVKSGNQYRVTIPLPLVSERDWLKEGLKVKWVSKGLGKLEIRMEPDARK